MADKKEKNEVEDRDEPIITEEQDEEEKVDSSEELDSSKEDEKEKVVQKTKPSKKRGNDTQKRINELWMARKEAEEKASQSANLVASERAKNQEYEKITASALEESLKSKRELLKERLIRAEETNDSTKKAEITAELSQVEAQSAQIERYKIENQVNPTQKPQQKKETQQEQVSGEELYERLSPAGKKWMDDNSDWYDVESESHDPEKFSDITYYAQKLERELASQGRASEVGTRAYFKKIDDYIKDNWGESVSDENEDSEEEKSEEKPVKKSYATPVGNRSVGDKSNGTRKEYKITQTEKEMAISLPIKGKNGQEMSDADKIKRFVALREGTPSSGPISMKTIRK